MTEPTLGQAIIVAIVVSAIVSAVVSGAYSLFGRVYNRLEREAADWPDEPVFTELVSTEPWFTTRCETCEYEVIFDDPIEPGQVSVVRCPQCGDAWAAVLPSVYVIKADQLELKQEQLIRGV